MNLSCLLCSSLFVGLAGCGDPLIEPGPPTGVFAVTVTPTSTTMNAGDTLRFAALVKTAVAGVDTTVTWRSSNSAVVMVDSVGLATAVTVGSASIVATSKADATHSGAVQVAVRLKP